MSRESRLTLRASFLSGKKCTYGVKCKFYHPERTNRSQLSVADELRDRAKTSNYKPGAGGSPAHPPSLSTNTNEPLHSEHSVSQSPRGPPRPPAWPNAEADEAFGSLDRLYAPDGPPNTSWPPYSYSSGVASWSLGHDDYSLSGSHGGTGQSLAGTCCFPHNSRQRSACAHCACGRYRGGGARPPAWASCPAAPLHLRDPPLVFSEKGHFGQPAHEQSQSLPGDARGLGRHPGGPSGELRDEMRSTLSTLYPKDTVEGVMNAYPHVSEVTQLIALIQSYRS